MKRALSFFHLGHTANAFQTHRAAFSKAVVKAVTIPSVLLRWLCRPTAAIAELCCNQGGAVVSQTDGQTDSCGLSRPCVHPSAQSRACRNLSLPGHTCIQPAEVDIYKVLNWTYFPKS